MRIVQIEETASTNSWLAANSAMLEAPCLVYALRQTAGRGQRGNSWESEPGKNITASVLLTPENIEPARQFAISEGIALAVVDFLAGCGVWAEVKWPNDIYVADRKICGILIEHSIMGTSISRTIAGIGINVNQREFLSDAPNPVSISQLTGADYSIAELAGSLGECIDLRMREVFSPAEKNRQRLHAEFMARMWRREGFHPFHDRIRNQRIAAHIADVEPDGMLTLALEDGEKRRFAFKEVEFILT